MKLTLATTTLVLMLAGGAFAQQETYGDLYEKGALDDISQMETNVGRLLRQHGVPDSCLAQLTVTDAGDISAVVNSDYTQTEKEFRVKTLLTERCQ